MCARFVDRRRANYSQTMPKLRVGMERLVDSNREPAERGVCGGRVVPCYSFSQDFERHSGLRSAQLSGLLVIPLLKASCHLMPQRSHASCAALLPAQKGEKLAGRKCEKWGKTGWGRSLMFFLAWLLHCFQFKHVQKDFINENHSSSGNPKCLSLASNFCHGLIYLTIIKRMSLHLNSHFNNIDTTQQQSV